jgi:hypothetical protein
MNCDEFLDLHDLLLDAESGRGPTERGESVERSVEDPTPGPGDGEALRTLRELREHRDGCARCRAEVAEVAGHADLANAISALPTIAAPSAPRFATETVAPRSPPLWRTAVAASVVSSVAAVISVLVLLSFDTDVGGDFAPNAGVEVHDAKDWSAASAFDANAERLLRTTDRSVRIPLTPNVAIDFSPNSYFRVVDETRVRLEYGHATVRVRRTEPRTVFVLDTPVASIEAKGTVFAGDVGRADDEIPGIPSPRKEHEMSSSLKVVPIAAVVSVFVSIGTVAVYNSVGSVNVTADGSATVAKNTAPELVRLPQTVAQLRKELAATREAIRELEQSGPEAATKIQMRLAAVEEKIESSALASAAAAEISAKAKDPEKILADAEEIYASLKKRGHAAYQRPEMAELVKKLRQLEDGGHAFVLAGLSSEDAVERFVAAALAEELQDPQLIGDLKGAALDDENLLVRRMSSHALAFMNEEDAVGALVEIVESEKRDPGVGLNAWYGLARQNRPEAVSTFEGVLNGAGGVASANTVVATALSLDFPELLPGLRLAYDNDSVSSSMKGNILRKLAKAASGEYDDFVRQVANDQNVSEKLRKAAQDAIDRN